MILVNTAIGDSLGAGFEFNDAEKFRPKLASDLCYIHNKSLPFLLPGNYTDDTQMSLAIAELIISGIEFNKYNLCDYFLKTFKRDIRLGYASKFYDFLESVDDPNMLLNNIKKDSKRCGGAMRSAVLGLYKDIEEVKSKTVMQCSITHDTVEGINGSLMVSLLTHYFTYQLGTNSKSDITNFLSTHINFPIDMPLSVLLLETKTNPHISIDAYPVVLNAINAIIECDSLSDIAIKLTNQTGDIDSALAIAFGMIANSNFHWNDLPMNLYTDIENVNYGLDYLINMDKKLANYFNLSIDKKKLDFYSDIKFSIAHFAQ